MTLQLRAICDVIAALTVTNGTVNVTFYDIDKVKNSYPDADCPAALILPADDEVSATFTPMAIDSSGYIGWNIAVLYLEKPVAQGMGWMQHAEAVATFVENFTQALIDAKDSFCALDNVFMTAITPRRGVWEFPGETGRKYYGAMFVISFRDFTRIT